MTTLLTTPPPVPAENALAGQPPGAMASQPADTEQAPSVAGPATEGPANPGQSAAQHIISALAGGGAGHPMDWAASIVGGALAASANVGKQPEGAGWLHGAAQGAQGVQEVQRQKAQDLQKRQQQQQEMALKQKADARADQELQIALKNSDVQVAKSNAETIKMIHEDQRAQTMAPYLEEEAKGNLANIQEARGKSAAELKAIGIRAGIKPEDLEDSHTDYSKATPSLAKSIGSGETLLMHNGETAKEGEDGVGVHTIPNGQNLFQKPLSSDTKVISGYDLDAKGNPVPKYTTMSAGHTFGDVYAMYLAAQGDLSDSQKKLTDQATLSKLQSEAQTQGVNAANAQTDKKLAQQKTIAETGEARAGIAERQAGTEQKQEETKQLKDWDNANKQDAFGNQVGAPGMDRKEFVKRVDTYNKDYSKDLNQLDQARSQLDGIITNAEKTGKLPGADAVVGIFDAIGISSAPLKGRGFRINSDVIGEHVTGTRNAWQGMALKLARLSPEGTGQIVSLQQLKDYERIMDAARHDAYLGASGDAVNRGIGIQSVPRGSGAAIDNNTMDIFLTMAKGDPTKAATIAKQYGWNPPSTR